MRRARGVPLRLASKSLRVRALQERASAAGFVGTLCFTLPEALWLASNGWDDLVVAYPTVDRGALRELAHTRARADITVMVDCLEHLDAIEAAGGGPVKVCIDVDAGWRLGLMAIGAKRSPLHDVAHVTNLASAIAARPGIELDGLMAYEAQIAGVGDAPPGKPLLRLALPVVQALSARELARRRAAIVDAVREIAPLRFVNGGGTGSIERTAAEPAVTEVAAGSGLYGPTLFDTYRGVQAAARRAVRAAGRAQAVAEAGDGPRRRLPGLGRRGARSAAAPGPSHPPAGPARGRGRGADAARGQGARPACGSATGSGSATPRPASCASASTSCISSAASRSSTPCRPIAARARPSSRATRRRSSRGSRRGARARAPRAGP